MKCDEMSDVMGDGCCLLPADNNDVKSPDTSNNNRKQDKE